MAVQEKVSAWRVRNPERHRAQSAAAMRRYRRRMRTTLPTGPAREMLAELERRRFSGVHYDKPIFGGQRRHGERQTEPTEFPGTERMVQAYMERFEVSRRTAWRHLQEIRAEDRARRWVIDRWAVLAWSQDYLWHPTMQDAYGSSWDDGAVA